MSFSNSDDDQRAHRVFSRRAALIAGLQVATAGVLGWRLYDLQVTRSDDFATLAEENRVDLEPLAPQRGRLLDRHGDAIAVNRQTYSIFLRVDQSDALKTSLERLRDLIGVGPETVARFLERVREGRSGREIELLGDVDWETFARVNANAPALPGVRPLVGWRRIYPQAAALAHITGYVGAVSQKDLRRERNPILRLPGARIGKTGVERAIEQRLRGVAGARRVEVNAMGREIRELSRREGENGPDVVLTIDLDLQRYVAGRLGDESASVALMDVQSGEVLSLVSTPSFDPNKFVTGVSHADWNALVENPDKPLLNKTSSGLYPPGSTFKMITALAALEYGAPTPGDVVRCRGSIEFGNRRFHCWKRDGHGRVRMHDAIKNSCDVYFYEVAQQVGIQRLAAMARRFGVGAAPEILLPGVKAGLMPTPAWRAKRGEHWNGGETLNAAIGQGAVLMSPLQMAVMTARLAQGERQVAARMIKSIGGDAPPQPAEPPLGVPEAHLKIVRDGLFAASNERGGTAYAARIADPSNLLAGKTGTAQVRNISAAERETGVKKNEELPRELRDHAMFVAYAPAEKPRYAIAVVVEHGGSGSKAAAPIARDVLMRALYGAEPPLDAYPEEIREEISAMRGAAL